MKEHILAFGCEPIAPLLTQTFAPRKMAVKAVPLADYAQTVGALACAADCPRTEEVYAGPPLAEPMLEKMERIQVKYGLMECRPAPGT